MTLGFQVDYAPLLERAFALNIREDSYKIENVEGHLPDSLRGSYFVNGPARFSKGGQRYRHWLDGDGMVCALHFSDDGVHFLNRFVRTEKLKSEEAADRPLFRAFGTSFAGDRLERDIGLASPVNVSVYPFADTLLAFGEQGLPWQLDPVTLETIGRYDFGRQLNPISPFSAHANIDYDSGELFNFGVSFSAKNPSINLYRFDANGLAIYRRRHPLDYPCSLHDFGLSANYLTFYLSPHLLDMEPLLSGGTVMDALSWEPERGSRLLVAERGGGDGAVSIPIGQGYSLHQVNCFERDGTLSVDVIELDRPIYDQYFLPELFTDVRQASAVRYTVDPVAGKLLERVALPSRFMCDFPAIDPRRATREYDDLWVLGISAWRRKGRKFFDQLVHLSWSGAEPQIYRAPENCYLGGEPVFAPAGEAAGSIICQEFDAAREATSFLIFDAFDITSGPVARLPLRSPIHLGFHASFASAAANRTGATVDQGVGPTQE